MLTKSMMKEYARSLGIPVSGVCSAEPDEELLKILRRRREAYPVSDFEEQDVLRRCSPKALMPEACSVFVCMFPYHLKDLETKNLSCYAAVPDYHRIAGELLGKIEAFVCEHQPGVRCLSVCDTSPLVDRWLAYRAGLGFFGKNHLLIHPIFGSYFFIGSLLLDFPLEPDHPLKDSCADCGACLSACPGGALSEDFGFDCNRCISYLTQKKVLTEGETELLMSQNSVYGCDVCQRVCPHNRDLPETSIQAFHQDVITELREEDVCALSNRAFKKQYGSYAFSWCSKDTIRKNFHK